MKLAIVGTSHLSENEELDARKVIAIEIQKYKKEQEFALSIGHIVILEIISGDAIGIDTIVRELAVQYNIPFKMYKALEKQWYGKYGYKRRNTEIANDADYVISVTTQTKTQKCFHCNKDHQRTGGCYTLNSALKLGKKGEVIVI